MMEELDRVVLVASIPAHGLEAGDIGTIVMVHQGGQGYSVEFLTLDGETVAVETLRSNQVRPIRPNEVAHARQLASA
ncbi:MAG TPA: DUF4926 domain-containing protein [Ktedonobacterales bacterium]